MDHAQIKNYISLFVLTIGVKVGTKVAFFKEVVLRVTHVGFSALLHSLGIDKVWQFSAL